MTTPDDKARAARPLLDLLEPILVRVAGLVPAQRTTREQAHELELVLEREFPRASERLRSIGERIAAGVREGWLCDRGEATARFSRLAKPSPATAGLSVDVVSLSGSAIAHTHPLGEVTIGFAVEGEQPSFDGRPPGWVVAHAGSRHTPTVTGGRMHLIYFIPDGVVEWHPD